MSERPLVSIIMPLYNKRPYVRRAIESVCAQTFTEWELVVIDDGSTDGSLEEVPHDDPRIRVFQQENRGPSAARNRGVELSNGEFVDFLDADDYYYPLKIGTEMELLHKQGLADWMVSASEFEVNGQVIFQPVRDSSGGLVDAETSVFENAFSDLTVAGWPSDGICMRKSLFQQIRGFREDLHYGEITELEIRAALAQPRMVIHQKPLYRVVDIPKSTSYNVNHRIDNMRQMGEVYNQLSREYPPYSSCLANSSRESFYSYALTLSLTGRGSQARAYLTNGFPHSRDKRWWKMWIGSWIPVRILRRFVEMSPELRET